MGIKVLKRREGRIKRRGSDNERRVVVEVIFLKNEKFF